MNYLKIKYKEANLEQITKAKETFIANKKNFPVRLLSQQKSEDTFEKNYPSYDKDGNLTLVGKAKRLTDLQNKGLSEDATIGEYFTKSWDDFQNKVATMIENFQERFKFY